ncbi:MAG TPA: DUF4383 domain-containing protein [Candidatus Polarisedimenticolia bacterium]|nr:DUF4383 domain-containing protein [Candidatus Polarisedimenticolia bacterium]
MFALIYGLAFAVVGLAGFMDQGMAHETQHLFGVFPVNGLHNFFHLLIGLAGIAVYFGTALSARYYAQTVGIIYLVLGFLGFVTPDLFGLMPIGGADIALHFIAAAIALYFGYAPASAVETRRPITH